MDKREIKGFYTEGERQNETMDAGPKRYTKNDEATINLQGAYMRQGGKEFEKRFLDARESGIGERTRYVSKGDTFYVVGGASGNYITAEHPGKSSQEIKENLQLPPGNEAEIIRTVRATRPFVAIESQIKEQPDWAAKGNYKARDGINQIYLVNHNEKGAIADGKIEVIDENFVENMVSDIEKRQDELRLQNKTEGGRIETGEEKIR